MRHFSLAPWLLFYSIGFSSAISLQHHRYLHRLYGDCTLLCNMYLVQKIQFPKTKQKRNRFEPDPVIQPRVPPFPQQQRAIFYVIFLLPWKVSKRGIARLPTRQTHRMYSSLALLETNGAPTPPQKPRATECLSIPQMEHYETS